MSTLRQQRESRPAGDGTATQEIIAGQALSILQPLAEACPDDTRPELTTAEVYSLIRGRLAAHVIAKDAAGRITCRSYANLRAADRAVTRAREAGKAATVVLCRLDVAPLVGEVAR